MRLPDEREEYIWVSSSGVAYWGNSHAEVDWLRRDGVRPARQQGRTQYNLGVSDLFIPAQRGKEGE